MKRKNSEFSHSLLKIMDLIMKMLTLYFSIACLIMQISLSVEIFAAVFSGVIFISTLISNFNSKKALENRGFNVLIHRLIPPNDGGISIGQAFYGMNKLKDGGI